jgi:hypothetical protein
MSSEDDDIDDDITARRHANVFLLEDAPRAVEEDSGQAAARAATAKLDRRLLVEAGAQWPGLTTYLMNTLSDLGSDELSVAQRQGQADSLAAAAKQAGELLLHAAPPNGSLNTDLATVPHPAQPPTAAEPVSSSLLQSAVPSVVRLSKVLLCRDPAIARWLSHGGEGNGAQAVLEATAASPATIHVTCSSQDALNRLHEAWSGGFCGHVPISCADRSALRSALGVETPVSAAGDTEDVSLPLTEYMLTLVPDALWQQLALALLPAPLEPEAEQQAQAQSAGTATQAPTAGTPSPSSPTAGSDDTAAALLLRFPSLPRQVDRCLATYLQQRPPPKRITEEQSGGVQYITLSCGESLVHLPIHSALLPLGGGYTCALGGASGGCCISRHTQPWWCSAGGKSAVALDLRADR